MDKRFIEESFPVKEVGSESKREKRIHEGHISTLHTWWARRPLASSRATNYAALIPASKDDIDWVKKRNFIIELSKWENSLDQNIIEKAREDILESNGGKPPKVLDPFSGGGAIPLEALRLGCETYANDYNPVAVLIEKCTLEYPQKYGQPKGGEWSETQNQLVEDIKKWGTWVLKETKKEIGQFYPEEPDGSIPVGYIWARTLTCQNPECGAEIPLMKQFWLAKNKNKKIALKLYVKNNEIKFKIVGQNNNPIPEDFDPSQGTIRRATVTCPICGSSIEAKKTRKLFQKNQSGEKMIAVALSHHQKKGKTYRLATKKDMDIFKESNNYLKQKRAKLNEKWGMDPLPNEEIIPVEEISSVSKSFNTPNYGVNTWMDLFNPRQQLAVLTFAEKIRDLPKFGSEKYHEDIIKTYLSFSMDKMASFNTKHGFWLSIGEKATQIFARHAIPMLWDYVETNPFANSFGWKTQIKWICKCIKHLCNTSSNAGSVTNDSATSLKYPDNYFDAIFTDPPYYYNVLYSYLSNFFYVWLKRTIGDEYKELFSTPKVPKTKEIIAKPNDKNSKEFFEHNLKKSFKEINRVLKKNGVATIVYAHKTTQGWETVINSLLDSGLTVTASWPLSTEMGVRLNARQTASLASSIYIVARKFEKTDIGWYKDVKEEIKEYVPKKLDKLWQEGISGADFFIAAIGSAIEIFGKYKKIMDNEGNEIRADKLLTFVRGVVTDYAMHQILHNGTAAELSALSKFYLLWRWNYQELSVTFDEARKLAQSAGIDISQEWNRGFIVKRGDKISVQGPDKRDPKTLQEPIELIDVLHKVCLLWKAGKTIEMKKTMQESGYANNDTFYKVAQAISETLNNSNSEKKLIEGFLAGKENIIKDNPEVKPQKTLI